MKAASASTIQKWPERLPLSPGQTERTPGLVASELECDKLSAISGLFQPEKQNRNNAVSPSQQADHENIDNCSHSLMQLPVPKLPLHGCFFHLHLIVNTGLKKVKMNHVSWNLSV